MRGRHVSISILLIFCFLFLFGCATVNLSAKDPLKSWIQGEVKNRIICFVKEVTNPSSRSYVLPKDRIAVFDNDGTLMCEKPLSVPEAFIFNSVATLVGKNPAFRNKQPFKAVCERDRKCLEKLSSRELGQLVLAPYLGVTQDGYIGAAKTYLAKSRHPRFNVSFTKTVYLPMIELLEYLRSNGFKVYIVSGGMTGLIRAFSEEVYDVPRENVIGTTATFKYSKRDGKSLLVRRDKFVMPINDYDGKAINIQLRIGKRPILAVGNSNGDQQMLEFTDDREGLNLMLLVHHDDAEREYRYDKGAEKVLNLAKERSWTIISIKNDFKTVFALGNKGESK